MDSFSNGFASSTSIKPSSVTNPSYNDAGGNNENELTPEIAAKLKKPQLPTKNFMSPTICTANKAAVSKKKVLAERNETLEVAEQTSLVRSSSFGSKSVKSPVVNSDSDVQKPYDPINNYLSPRPKFLRYNPDRRRKIFVLQENEDSVKNSNSFDAGLELGGDSTGFVDSCSPNESVVEGEDNINKAGECEEEGESDDEEEEVVEFEEDNGWKLTGFLKFLFAVIAVILTTNAICSMNSPTNSQTLESWSDFYGVAGLNVSEVGSCSITETNLVEGRLKEVDMVETIDDEVVSEEESSDSLQELGTLDLDEENDEADVIHGEMWIKQEEIVEIEASEAIEIREVVEGEREFDDQMLTADSDENEEIAEFEIAQEMDEINDVAGESETNEEEEEQFVNSTPSLKYDDSGEISHSHAPSVQLLGEFVFGEEADASNSLIHAATVSSGEAKSSNMETSTGDSVAYTEKTVRKQRRKNVEATAVVSPSPVRRSSRLQSRSVKSP
ncbi:hypothetical protein L2E82_16620 [Cichorium intybus]|uniref:Uncharacterized protein n=1 Tax=Cichorium intybus TaxID=13427 RepID=A0ACB9F798_CICIN|nr:hypothetical protein L2E82_16620 [Cichorium intybus]